MYCWRHVITDKIQLASNFACMDARINYNLRIANIFGRWKGLFFLNLTNFKVGSWVKGGVAQRGVLT